MNTLREKWKIFLAAALGPGPFILVMLTIASLVLSYVLHDNQEIAILLASLGSIFGGIAGGYIKDAYSKISGANVLEKKGLSAIRNLESVGKQLANLRNAVRGFRKEKTTKAQGNILSEIIRHLSTMELNIQSGFADWIDMVPSLAKEAERVAKITSKEQDVVRAYLEEILKSKKELIVLKDKKRVDELKERIGSLEDDIKDIRADGARISLTSTSSVVGTENGPFSSGASLFGNSHPITLAGLGQTCANCGKNYQPSLGISGITSIGDSYCDDCKDMGLKPLGLSN